VSKYLRLKGTLTIRLASWSITDIKSCRQENGRTPNFECGKLQDLAWLAWDDRERNFYKTGKLIAKHGEKLWSLRLQEQGKAVVPKLQGHVRQGLDTGAWEDRNCSTGPPGPGA
jgi:hypothetical protein